MEFTGVSSLSLRPCFNECEVSRAKESPNMKIHAKASPEVVFLLHQHKNQSEFSHSARVY